MILKNIESNAHELLQITLFGEFEVKIGSTVVTELRNRKADQLVAYLATRYPRWTQNAVIASCLWPETQSLDSLRKCISITRNALGENSFRLESDRGQLLLNIEGANVDYLRFKLTPQNSEPDELKMSITLARKGVLSGWSYLWVNLVRKQVQDSELDMLRRLIVHLRSESDLAERIHVLKRIVALNPTEQAPWTELLQTLVGAKEYMDATKIYDHYVKRLNERHDLAPPIEMQHLRDQISKCSKQMVEATHPQIELPGVKNHIHADNCLSHNPLAVDRNYILRDADKELSEAIREKPMIIVLQGTRETGKTTLLAHGLVEARQMGYDTVVSDLKSFPNQAFVDLESFCWTLMGDAAYQQGIELSRTVDWNALLVPPINLTRFTLNRLLSNRKSHLLWAMDGVERLFEMEFGSDFFAQIRSWHSKRSFDPNKPWSNLTVILTCSSEPQLFIRNGHQSPFNVGTRVDLDDFSRTQFEELIERMDCPFESKEEIEHLYACIGGHPALIELALNKLTRKETDLCALVHASALETGPFKYHLRHINTLINNDDSLRGALHKFVNRNHIPHEMFLVLRNSGLVIGPAANNLRFRCGIYEEFIHRIFA